MSGRPDPELYRRSITSSSSSSSYRPEVALVIDNGAWQCRAGFANQENPAIVCPSLVYKQRGKRDWEALVSTRVNQ